jgi:protein SCO1/2
MKLQVIKNRLLALALLVVSVAATALPAFPPDSIYQLPVTLTDQDGNTRELASHRGQPLIISMFYTSCQYVCPRIIEAAKRTEDGLTRAEQQQVPVVLVTFDPVHDDVSALKTVATERKLNGPAWTLARTDARDTRKLAAALGFQYRELANGDFNHTSMLVLLDAEGRIAGKTTIIGAADPAFVKLVKATLATKQ